MKKPVKSIAQELATLREQPGRIAANDSLFRDLEQRWGSGFAQWVIDGLGASPSEKA